MSTIRTKPQTNSQPNAISNLVALVAVMMRPKARGGPKELKTGSSLHWHNNDLPKAKALKRRRARNRMAAYSRWRNREPGRRNP